MVRKREKRRKRFHLEELGRPRMRAPGEGPLKKLKESLLL